MAKADVGRGPCLIETTRPVHVHGVAACYKMFWIWVTTFPLSQSLLF